MPVSMLDELIDRYGEGAILTVSPYVPASGETLRWIVEIDGSPVPDADVRTARHEGRRDAVVMLLVHGDEEVEIGHWSTTLYPDGPAAVIRRLGDLR
jgi:hypothetical protein